MSDGEDYEALRAKNIAAREAFLSQFLSEVDDDLKVLKNTRPKITEKENQSPRTPRQVRPRGRRSRARSPGFTGPRVVVHKKYNTRSRKRAKDESDDEQEEDEHDFYDGKDIVVSKKRSNIKVMFSWSRPIQRDIDLMNLNSEDENDSGAESDLEEFVPKRKRIQKMTRSEYDPSTIPSPEEITQRMLDNIATKASGKEYDVYNGTCCHQCRQKTKDTKTVCRSGFCVGVRGQFCGPCLKGRYGESAYDALKDPNWQCPPCRGMCNCSICRTRNGQRPTGILAPLAKEEGFNSVNDYLQATEYDD